MSFRTFEPTQTQLRMYESPGDGANLAAVFDLPAGYDQGRLARAVDEVVAHCATFSHRVMRIDGAWRIVAGHEDCPGLLVIDATAGETAFDTLIQGVVGRQFRLDGGAPYLFCLLKTRRTDVLVFVCHPALMDRFSLQPLFAALSAAYAGELGPGELGLDQEDLVRSERELLSGDRFAEMVRFWLQLGKDTSFEWHPPRLEADMADTSFDLALSPTQAAELAALADRVDIRTGELLLFCAHLLLAKLTGSETVMTSTTHRIRTGGPGAIGFNENKPAFKSELRPDCTVGRYLRLASRLLAMGRSHSDIPAREIAREIARKEPQFRRVTNVLITEDPLPYGDLVLDGAPATLLARFCRRLEVEDIAIHVSTRHGVWFHAMARSAQEASGLKLAFEHFIALLDHVGEDLEKPISALRCFDEGLTERARALAEGAPLSEPPDDVMVRFHATAARSPDAPAVRFRDRRLSYRDLQRSALAVAAGLRPHLASRPEPLVGICLPRSEGVAQAILGTLEADAGYVPLDPQMPADRLSFVVADSGVAAVIVDSETRSVLEAALGPGRKVGTGQLLGPEPDGSTSRPRLLLLEDLLEGPPAGEAAPAAPRGMPAAATQVAYVIYTSGTTGKPKGVVVERGNLAHLLASLRDLWERGEGKRWLQFASYTFDASILDLINPVVHGAEVVITPSEVRNDPEAIFALLRDEAITHAFMAPALLALLPRRPLPALEVILGGGEAIDEDAVRFWSKAVELANCYGPTEATVMCTANTMGGYKAANHLGRPISGYKTYLLGEDDALTPLGGVGEICVGGPGVARGYLNRPDLTAPKFGLDPFGAGRLYRTGDLGRYLPNGDLEFLGRRDFQVKVRGFRIELGDIESAIAEQPEIKGAHVGVRETEAGKALVAWYVSRELAEGTLRERLGARLPYYMVPSYLVRVDAFPLTIAGKIDRARLPEPTAIAAASGAAERLDDLQALVRDVWAATLKVAPATIGLDSQFFHLGGHSLLAALTSNRLTAELGRAVRPKVIFEHPVLADYCEQLRSLPQAQPALGPLLRTNAVAAPAESRMMGLMYSRAQSVPDDNMYNIVARVAFTPEMDAQRLAAVLGDLLAANPVFRAAFAERDGHIWTEAGPAPLPTVGVVTATEADVDRHVEEMRREAFGITVPPLWRARLFLLPDGAVTLAFAIHHSIFDGWSLNVLVEELAARYEAALAGVPYAVERFNWFDWCRWAVDLPGSQPFLESVAYWRKKLSGVEARVELPADRQQKRNNAGESIAVRFEPATVAKLRRLADDAGITLSPLLFALYLVWIWRISDQEEVVVGYPYAGRDVPGSEQIYASLVTMGFLRQRVRPDEDLVSLAQAVHRQMIDDKDHLTAAPYDAEIASADSMNVIFSLQSGINLHGSVGPARFAAREYPSLTSKGDIAGIFYETGDGGLEGRVEYDASLLSPELMTRLIPALSHIVVSAADRPGARVRELTYMNRAELDRFLGFATGPAFPPLEEAIPERFGKVAREHAGEIAVVYEDRTLTYAQLDAQSDAIAERLGDVLSARPGATTQGACVGLSLQKSDTAIAAILGVLKRGCAYVPLDPDYPPERLRFFVENARASLIVADTAGRKALEAAGLGHLTFLDPSDAPRTPSGKALPRVASDALAYIIHTSGSTGQPKGVMIEHRTVVRMVLGSSAIADLRPGSRSTLVASLSFDASVVEIFHPLLNGATLIVCPERVRKDPAGLLAYCQQHRATHVHMSPVMIQGAPRATWPEFEHLTFGGDTIDEATARWWSQATALFTAYGPTEITVQCSGSQILPGGDHRIIGKPLPGYRMYLLNSRREPVPPGAIGEICVGGDNLARGYLNREDLTLERFVADPFGASPYDLIYLTGDMGRFLPDGTMAFLGRRDGQVKVRGFRIELGEIESRMADFAGISGAACAVRGEGDGRMIVGYYVAAGDVAESALRAHVAAGLPDYMVPSLFVRLGELPLSPAGKVDRKALPAVAAKTCENPPRPGTEAAIAEVWEDVLRLRGIGRDESFFHVGGNSLLAVRLQAELRRRMGIDLSIADFYGAPTIEALASGQKSQHARQAERDATEPFDPPDWPTVAPGGPPVPAAGSQEPPAERSSPSGATVLLTGAAGFLGIFLLAELQERGHRVVALIRASDPESGAALLKRRARAAGVTIDLDAVEVVPGDLAAPHFGLAPGRRAHLAATVDTIIHNGAFVHHLHGYQTMRAANVLGTRELLRLALEERPKRFCLISTLGVAHAVGAGRADEASLPATPPVDNGYILTKWVAERLVARAAERYGIAAIIARPGNITGSTRSGYTNYSHNHFWLFNKGCLQLGHFPDVPAVVEMMPVDTLARAIAALSLTAAGDLFVANLANPARISQHRFFELLAAAGFSAAPQAVPDWQRQVAAVGEDNGLSTLKDFYLGELAGEEPDIVQSATLARLADLGVSFDADCAALVPTYTTYLRAEGFLPESAAVRV